MYGEFDNEFVEFFADVTVVGTIYETSDATLKTEIEPIQNSLEKIQDIRGVSFQWNDENMRK